MSYRAKNGITLASGERFEAGDEIPDDAIPKRSVSWLLRQGHMEEIEPKPKGQSKPGKES